MTDWTKVKNFKREEWITDPDKVIPELIYLMDELRDFIGKPCVIHVAWEDGGHSSTSKHYTGNAVDFHFRNIDPLDCYDMIEKFIASKPEYSNNYGIGLYPYWNRIGFHLDILARTKPGKWGRVLRRGKDDFYVSIKDAIRTYEQEKNLKRVVISDKGEYRIKR